MCLRLQVSSSATEAEDKWRKAQREDSDLAPVVCWLEAGQVRPSREEVAQESFATKHLVDQWKLYGPAEKKWRRTAPPSSTLSTSGRLYEWMSKVCWLSSGWRQTEEVMYG